MRAQVIDDALALLAVNHGGVEAASSVVKVELAQPGHRFSAKVVKVSVIFDGKGDVSPALRKQDVAPSTDIQKREGVKWAMPNILHHPGTNSCDFILTAKAKAPLNLGVEAL